MLVTENGDARTTQSRCHLLPADVVVVVAAHRYYRGEGSHALQKWQEGSYFIDPMGDEVPRDGNSIYLGRPDRPCYQTIYRYFLAM